MLRTNLSTHPFYNVRAVQTTLIAVAVIVALVSVANVAQVVSLTGAQRRLGAHADEAEREAERLRVNAAAVRGQINPSELAQVAGAAREANALIDRRAFSWTELFSQFEQTLPPDVRITAVQPQTDQDGTFKVFINVEARRVEDLDAFLEALESKSTFRSVLATQESTNEDDLIEALVQGVYVQAPRDREAAATSGSTP